MDSPVKASLSGSAPVHVDYGLFDIRLMQRLLSGSTQHLVDGWSMCKKRTFSILVLDPSKAEDPGFVSHLTLTINHMTLNRGDQFLLL